MPSPPAAIIIVEDDLDLLAALSFAFEVEGYAVTAYASAEALLGGPPPPAGACLIIDQRLPGLDGLGLLERLTRAGGRRLALLICTPDASLRRRAAAAGVEIVEKPLLSGALVERVRALLGGR